MKAGGLYISPCANLPQLKNPAIIRKWEKNKKEETLLIHNLQLQRVQRERGLKELKSEWFVKNDLSFLKKCLYPPRNYKVNQESLFCLTDYPFNACFLKITEGIWSCNITRLWCSSGKRGTVRKHDDKWQLDDNRCFPCSTIIIAELSFSAETREEQESVLRRSILDE